MKVIDLFAGIGGFSLAFKDEGYTIVSAYDNWDFAIKNYKSNFKHPIYKLDLHDVENAISEISKNDYDIIIGGPPCQDFSSAGTRNGNGKRANLTIDFANIIVGLKPQYFCMENVQMIHKYDALEIAKNIFRTNGYGLSEVILNASFFGVPQNRKRYFLIGSLGGSDDIFTEELQKKVNELPMAVSEYFGRNLDTKFYYRHPWSYNRRAIFSIEEPSPTIRGVNRPIPPKYKPHKGDATDNLNLVRPLTSLERMMIQTFPSNFSVQGTKTNSEQAIGNAVPVNLGKHVARVIRKIAEQTNFAE